MVILDEYKRFYFILNFIKNYIGKLLVNLLVLNPVFQTKYWSCMSYMAKRPKPFICKTIVVSIHFFFC